MNKKLFEGFKDIRPDRSLIVKTLRMMEEGVHKTSQRNFWNKRMKKVRIALALGIILIASLFTSQQFKPSSSLPTAVASNVETLPVVGDDQNLKKLLSEAVSNGFEYSKESLALGAGIMKSAQSASDSVTKSADQTLPSAVTNGINHSETNLQVAGVDEADIVKTDGNYLYQLKNPQMNLFVSNEPEKNLNTSEVIISKIYPASDLKVVSRLKFNQDDFMPHEMYVDSQTLILLGTTYEPTNGGPITKVLIYDLKDKTNPQKIREIKLDGSYISSRKIGSSLYFIANKYIDYYSILQQNQAPANPSYFDSNSKEGYTAVSLSQVHYFPGTIEPCYLMVAGVDLDRPGKEVQVSTYLGSGRNIYASASNLYVAMPHYEYEKSTTKTDPAPKDTMKLETPMNTTTQIYEFGFKQGETVYKGKGEVPGQILNQFSMDEYKGYFRIATTKGNNSVDNQFTNNVYILDHSLKLTGSLEGLALGEKIHSVRFMGDRAYMVTFQTVDPLFVIDLKDPKQPKTLGQLKIPGYSDYLQPYDENHLIGIGKETIEIPSNGPNGPKQTMAYYLGMKLAMFDVSDVAKPKELFKETIGDRGTDSEVLRNHKALLFDKEKNLLAFPVTVYEVNGAHQKNIPNTNPPQYGKSTFQGAYVYNVNLEQGFSLKGKITHVDNTSQKSPQYSVVSQDQAIQRILFVGENLYTVSEGKIKVNDLKTLDEKGTLNIP